MSAEYLSLLGIILGVTFFIAMAYRGLPVLFVGPLSAIIVAVFSQQNPIPMLTGPFMQRFANFTQSWFLVIMFSSMFGKMMSVSGAADALANKLVGIAMMAKTQTGQKVLAVLSLVVINATLTYGGVSLYAAAFTLVAIAKRIFQNLNVPWKFYTCSSLGSGVFTMTMLPGSPQLHNNIPTKYLGTTPMAGPWLGIIGTILAIMLGIIYCWWVVREAERKNEGFLPSGDIISTIYTTDPDIKPIPLIKCLFPSIVLLVVLNVFKQPLVLSLICALLTTYILFFPSFRNNPVKMLNEAISNAVGAVANVCSATGFGGVVAAVSGYKFVLSGLSAIPGPALFQVFVSVNIAAGITGAGSGGLVICLENLGDHFLATGINPEVIHRIAAMSSGGLDTLPHCGAVVNTLSIAKLNHRDGYKNYFWLSVVLPIIVTLICMYFASLGVV